MQAFRGPRPRTPPKQPLRGTRSPRRRRSRPKFLLRTCTSNADWRSIRIYSGSPATSFGWLKKTRPNSDRLEEYRDSGIKSLELSVFSDAPIYPEFEEAKLADSLADWKKSMQGDPLVEHEYCEVARLPRPPGSWCRVRNSPT